VTWRVYRNTGVTWNTTPELWVNNAAIDAHLAQADVVLADANGDGLADIVKSIGNGGSNIWKVFLNKGTGFATTSPDWIGAAAHVDVDILTHNVAVADVTGDGLPDILKTDQNQGSLNTWQVWRNNGRSPDLLAKVTTTQGGTTSFDYGTSTMVDNTGVDEQPDLPFSLWLVAKMTTNNGMTNQQQTNDVTTYSYRDGFYKWQEREFRGFGTIDEVSPNGARKNMSSIRMIAAKDGR
jgi:Insecticide toxin TcdB middle/N-terminal region